MSQAHESLVAQERRRANSYRLLSALYQEPTEQLRGDIEECDPAEYEIDVKQLQATQEELQQLRIDYARLFVGPMEVLAPPYESVYVDNSERVMTESTTAVEYAYRTEGLDIDLDEPADHISAQLEFLFLLVVTEIEALAAGDEETAQEYLEKQYEFSRSHLGRWVSEFAENVTAHAKTPFYETVATETVAFVEGDGKRLAKRIETLRDGTIEQALSEEDHE